LLIRVQRTLKSIVCIEIILIPLSMQNMSFEAQDNLS